MYSGSFQNLNLAENHPAAAGSLSNLSSGSEGNLMRGPGSDLDLNALYKSDFNRSLPNVPNTLSVPNQFSMNHSASNPNMAPAPMRMAPAPPPAFMPVGQPSGLAQVQPNAFSFGVQNGGVQNMPGFVPQNGPNLGFETNFTPNSAVPEIKISEAPLQGKYE